MDYPSGKGFSLFENFGAFLLQRPTNRWGFLQDKEGFRLLGQFEKHKLWDISAIDRFDGEKQIWNDVEKIDLMPAAESAYSARECIQT